MLKLKLQYFATWWKRPWRWERLRTAGEGGDRGWDGWMTPPTRWTWVWARFGSWGWTGKPGVLQSMGSQRVRHNWATSLNWTENKYIFNFLRNCQLVLLGGYTSFLPTISEWKFSAFSIFKNIWHSLYFSMLPFLVYMCKDISCWFQFHSINDDKFYQHFNLLFHLSSIFLNLIPVLPHFFSTKFICSLVKYKQITYAWVCFCTTYSNPLIYFLHWKMYHILLIIVVFTDFKFIKYKYLDFVLYFFSLENTFPLQSFTSSHKIIFALPTIFWRENYFWVYMLLLCFHI